jgi:hypothetical protein
MVMLESVASGIVASATGCIIVGKIHASQDPGNYMKVVTTKKKHGKQQLSLLLSGRRYVQFIEVACQTEKQSSMVYHQVQLSSCRTGRLWESATDNWTRLDQLIFNKTCQDQILDSYETT